MLFTLTAGPTFPEGTAVKAYLRGLWGGQTPPVTGSVPAAPVAATSAPVDAHGYAAFSGLEPGTQYLAGAQVGGVWRWVGFSTVPNAEGFPAVAGTPGQVLMQGANGTEWGSGGVASTNAVFLAGQSMGFGVGALAGLAAASTPEQEKHTSNTAIGWHAMQTFAGSAGTSAEDNTAVGSQALLRLTTGGGNTAVGENAGVNLTTGEENTVVGCEALGRAKTTLGNVAIGFRALGFATTGAKNVAVGWEALSENVVGTENVGVGHQALSATLNSKVTGVGYAVLRANTEGSQNTGMGTFALAANTTANFNTAIGSLSMQTNVTGKANTALGASSLAASTGSQNVAVGYATLDGLTSGGNNTALGFEAGGTITKGSGNLFLGFEAGPVTPAEHNNELFIHNVAHAEPLIWGNFANRELRLWTTKIGFFGATPVVQPGEIKTPTGETTAELKAAVKAINEAGKGLGLWE